MHEDAAAELNWREIVVKHQSDLIEDLSVRLASDVREAVSSALAEERSQSIGQIARACDEARRSHSESLNQALRRLRLATSEEKAFQLLSETCAPWAERSVILTFADNRADSAARRGISGGGEFTFELASAPAVASAIESRDPLVTIASGDQISPALALAFGGGGDNDGYDKAWLFPLVSHHAVFAMLAASGNVDPAPVELLCEAASMRLESLAGASPAIASEARPVTGKDNGLSWDDLSSDDQKLHLQAQRVARVRVAEMRLYDSDAVESGLASANLYSTLRTRIDAARREFLQLFLSKSTTMVDYIHLEILRSLAKDDVALLGTVYPGPMV